MIGVEIIDSDYEETRPNDNVKMSKHPLNLYRTKEKDTLIDDFIYFLNVIDPSTGRAYYICVPECENVWDAKAWTFQNKKIEIRHGDVSLLNLKQEFKKPQYES
jgi:predicted  nucleic acid-binding Zn ribbon protein